MFFIAACFQSVPGCSMERGPSQQCQWKWIYLHVGFPPLPTHICDIEPGQ